MILNKKYLLNNPAETITLLISFSIPFYQNIIPILIVALFFTTVNKTLYKNLFSRTLNETGTLPKFIFYTIVIFYLLHIAALTYSSNLSFGFLDIQIKLSLLLLPVLFVCSDKFKDIDISKVILFYVAGAYIACVINLLLASFKYLFVDFDPIHFSPENISTFQHIGYFSIYLNFAWFAAYFLLLKNKYNKIIQFFLALSLPFFAFFILLTGSKNGIILLVILASLITTYAIIKTKKLYLGLSIFVALIVSLLYIFTGESVINKRIERALNSTTNYSTIDKTSKESTAARMMAWDASIDLIRENFIFGVGSGDIKDELMNKYSQKGYTGILEEKLNPHNQYLQTFGALGIIGFLVIVTMYLSIFIYAIKKREILMFAFILIVIISSLTESILERQAGVFFFAFFASLFLVTNMNKGVKSKSL
jgi:O-antigen ligase